MCDHEWFPTPHPRAIMSRISSPDMWRKPLYDELPICRTTPRCPTTASRCPGTLYRSRMGTAKRCSSMSASSKVMEYTHRLPSRHGLTDTSSRDLESTRRLRGMKLENVLQRVDASYRTAAA